MTWGQLRLQLQTSAPGVSLDLLDEYLANRYQQVLAMTDWTGIKAHGSVTTQAAYQSAADTVALTVGSTLVTVTGKTWTNAINGYRFYRPGDTVIYTATWASSSTFNLDRPYEGNGADAVGTVYSAAAYVFMQHIYALPSDCRSVVTILDPVTALPLNRMTKDNLDQSAGTRTLVADPASFADYDDSAETSPPVLHQVEFYPPPLRARAFSVEYLRNANVFTGSNTTASPLPFVSDSVILYGCRADIAGYLAGQAAAADPPQPGAAAALMQIAHGHEAKFQEELGRLLRVEHQQRRKMAPIKVADRFTRHRLSRTLRGYNNYWGRGQGGPN